jgi:hypothetical protein
MEKKDFRGIGRDAQEALRARAVYLVLIQRKTQAEAAEAVGVGRQFAAASGRSDLTIPGRTLNHGTRAGRQQIRSRSPPGSKRALAV